MTLRERNQTQTATYGVPVSASSVQSQQIYGDSEQGRSHVEHEVARDSVYLDGES